MLEQVMTTNVTVEDFGVTSDSSETVKKYTITNASGSSVELIEYGASIRSLMVPVKDGRKVDVVLGHEHLAGYEKNDAYLGCVVGRVCNRIR